MWHNVLMSRPKKKKKDTSWEGVAYWYDSLLEGEGTYQKELILPNLLRLMEIHPKEEILDIACGQGFFSRAFAENGARVSGIDTSRSLIAIAKEADPKSEIDFQLGKADALPFPDNRFDKAVIVLALQNINEMIGALKEAARVIKKAGALYIVLNHPAFRIPRASGWGWDEKKKVQYRRIDKYLSEAKIQIDMHPGVKSDDQTISFHRPLQFYFKALNKAGFVVAALEEWNSHRKSEPGPRAAAEDLARKEIPLFLCLIAKKI